LTEKTEGADEDKYFDANLLPPSPMMHTSWQWSCWRMLRYLLRTMII